MIGNDYLKDIASAKSVGLKTIWYAHAPCGGGNQAADFIIHSMNQLVAAVSQLDAKC